MVPCRMVPLAGLLTGLQGRDLEAQGSRHERRRRAAAEAGRRPRAAHAEELTASLFPTRWARRGSHARLFRQQQRQGLRACLAHSLHSVDRGSVLSLVSLCTRMTTRTDARRGRAHSTRASFIRRRTLDLPGICRLIAGASTGMSSGGNSDRSRSACTRPPKSSSLSASLSAPGPSFASK